MKGANMTYEAAWTLKDGKRIEKQLYTADAVSNLLHNLELWGATDIVIKSKEKETNNG
jgi:hypothetical protein